MNSTDTKKKTEEMLIYLHFQEKVWSTENKLRSRMHKVKN